MDEYTLAILPLACLAGDIGQSGQCCAGNGRDWTRYNGVLDTGVLGYRLYTYHGLVKDSHGEYMAHRVRDRHIAMFLPDTDLGNLLAMIDSAVGLGAMTTPTPQGGITTPVELNVALALLLGLPRSPHYTTGQEQRREQIGRILPGLDWCFADCLARARREMVGIFDWLGARVNINPRTAAPAANANCLAGG